MSVTEVSVHYSAVLTAQHPGTAGQTLAPCCADARCRSDRADTLQWLVSGMLRSTECPVPFVSVLLRSAAFHSHGWPFRLCRPLSRSPPAQACRSRSNAVVPEHTGAPNYWYLLLHLRDVVEVGRQPGDLSGPCQPPDGALSTLRWHACLSGQARHGYVRPTVITNRRSENIEDTQVVFGFKGARHTHSSTDPPAHQCRRCGGSRWRLGQRSETSPRAAQCALRRAAPLPWDRYRP